MADAPEAFVWGANGARLTPEQAVAQRKVADALALQAGDGSAFPTGTRGAGLLTQGLNRVAKGISAGMDYREADAADKANAADNKAMIAALLGGGAQAPVATSAAPAVAVAPIPSGPAPTAAPTAAPAASTPVADRIFNEQDKDNPFEPSAADRVNMVATALGEQPAGSAAGLGAINTIRNRTFDGEYGGTTPTGVVLAPKQYSANNDPAKRAELLARATANTPEVAKVQDAIDQAYGTGKYAGVGPNDPTDGKTHYYDPASMVPPNSVPSWAQGKQFQTIGSTRFYDDPDEAAAKPTQVAFAGTPPVAPGVAAVTAAANGQPVVPQSAAPAAPSPGVATAPAAPSAGVAKVAGAINPAVIQAMTSPYSSPSTKALATAVFQKQLAEGAKEHFTPQTDADGNKYDLGSNGERKMFSKADEKTTAQKDYEYYQGHFQPTPQQPAPMGFDTWTTAKAKAGAVQTNVTTTVGGENKGMEEAQKLDAEAVRKGQNEKMPALDDADRNFQMMQDAIERNGGKLPTGGVLAKLGLDARRTSSYIRDNWGIDLGDDPTTAVSLETMNKGGIKASGDMARAIGGNRVLKVEFDMAQKANPGLETTDGGNKYLIDLNRNTIAIQKDHLQAQEDYWRGHNHSLDGFQKEWTAEVKANPRPLSNFSVVPPIDNGNGTQMIKLPSTGQGGYSWYQKGPDGNKVITDSAITSKLEEGAKPLRAAEAAPVEKTVGGVVYVKQGNNWFEKH